MTAAKCKPAKPRPWTEAHRREALRRTYELAAEAAGAPRSKAVAWFMVEQGDSVDSELTWRAMLSSANLDPARIDREVRRVDRLARGLDVRETGWRAPSPVYTGEQKTAAMTVLVTRIRRAP